MRTTYAELAAALLGSEHARPFDAAPTELSEATVKSCQKSVMSGGVLRATSWYSSTFVEHADLALEMIQTAGPRGKCTGTQTQPHRAPG
eukprot:279072-Prymnesium_polylepis.2